jgi:site-specific DNA recombinase
MEETAIYARVSSERQKDDQTIESQIAALKEEAHRRGWELRPERIFCDEGYSGANLERPGLEALRDLVYEGAISTVFAFAPDRLARKYALQVLLLEEFARSGTEVEFMRAVKGESPEEQLLLQFQGMIAEYERAQILERTRRGKRHKARQGLVNVLSAAPYGYRYVKAGEGVPARYLVHEEEAEVVGQVFEWYTTQGETIAGIVRRLNDAQISTRTGQGRWERSTMWGMLKNPAYKGTACFGKTKATPRKKRTRKLRQRGGIPPRSSSSGDVCRDQWIEIPVPPLVDQETFEWAQQRLEQNKKQASRRTAKPSLLQSLLVCDQCGYALYRTSTRTKAGKKIYYYRCIGSDNYRFESGRICERSPIRVDLLDELVWKELLRLLETPSLIEEQLQRRRHTSQAGVAQQRRDTLRKTICRHERQMNKLLDAYQEDLLSLEALRERMTTIKERHQRAQAELKQVATVVLDEERITRISADVNQFLRCLSERVTKINLLEKQAIARLLVKEVFVGADTIKIHHCVPLPEKKMTKQLCSYLLRTRRHFALVGEYFPALVRQIFPQLGRSSPMGEGTTGPILRRLRCACTLPGRAPSRMDGTDA